MERTDIITERQLTVLIFVSLLSPLIRTAPHMPVVIAGRAAWLSPILAVPAAWLLAALIRSLTKNAPAGVGLGEMASRSLGRAGGGVFCAAVALWLTFYAGILSRTAAERLLSSVFPEGSPAILVIVTLLAAAVASMGQVKGLARTAELLFPMLAAVIILVCASSVKGAELTRLLPVTLRDTGRALLGAVPVFDVISLHVYFLALFGHVKRVDKPRRFPFAAAVGLTALLITVLTLATVGEALAAELQNALLVVVRNARLFRVVERFESVVVAIWITTDFTMLAALIMIASELWRAVFSTEKRAVFVVPTAALAAASALLTGKNAFSLLGIANVAVPAVNLALTAAVIPLVLAAGKLRKKY